MTNVAHDFCGEIVFGAKDASSNEVALDFAKPDFNLVEPGGTGGGVIQGEIGIGRQKFGDAFGLVGREVIDDGVNSFARRAGWRSARSKRRQTRRWCAAESSCPRLGRFGFPARRRARGCHGESIQNRAVPPDQGRVGSTG